MSDGDITSVGEAKSLAGISEMSREEARRRLLMALPVWDINELHEILQWREKVVPTDKYWQKIEDIDANLHYVYDEWRMAIKCLVDTSI